MTKVQQAYARIRDAVELALTEGVNVFVGGDPAVVQVTQGRESYTLRTVPPSGGMPTVVSEPPLPAPATGQTPPRQPTAAPCDAPEPVAQQMGFSGDTCWKCHSARVVRTGTCATCLDCGETGGCS